jgi:hypothetical protein
VYLITAPKRGNTAGINDDIVAEIMLNTLYICLFNVEIVVETTNNNFSRSSDIELVVFDTTDNTLDSMLCNETVDIEVDTDVRVFPNNFTIEDTELDNAVKVFGMDFIILTTELEIAKIVDDMALRMVTVLVALIVNEIR